MRKMKWICLVLLFFAPVRAQQSYSVPSKLNELPVSYLEGLHVREPHRQLAEDDRKRLVRLFAWSYAASIRQYRQDYIIPAQAPIYVLLKFNFPELSKREGEAGIFLGQITRFFNRMPEYEAIVDDVLRNRPQRLKCRD